MLTFVTDPVHIGGVKHLPVRSDVVRTAQDPLSFVGRGHMFFGTRPPT